MKRFRWLRSFNVEVMKDERVMVEHGSSENEDEARRFLLGQLTPAEAERFETRLLADEELFEETEAVETELFDTFERGELSPDEHRVIEERLRRKPERKTFARALTARMERRQAPAGVPLFHRRRSWLAAAAAIVLILGGGLLWRVLQTREPLETVPRTAVERTRPTPPSSETARVVPPVERIATFAIVLAATREGDSMTPFVIDSGVRTVALRIRINPADRYSAYEIGIARSNGSPVWKGRGALDPATSEVTAAVPAASLRSGEYEIALFGIGEGGAREELGYQTVVFQIP